MDVLVYQDRNSAGHPQEDRYALGTAGRAVVVADGVTRDSYRDDPHPGGSGSGYAAELICRRVLAAIDGKRAIGADEFRAAFDAANREIGALNKLDTRTVPSDYLANDLYGAVALAAVIDRSDAGRFVRYGYVGDCRLAVAGPDQSIKIDNPYSLAGLHAHLPTQSFDSVEARRFFVRSRLRNNPTAGKQDGFDIGYGVFTGEPGVAPFYRFGSKCLDGAAGLLVFSDGITPFLNDQPFVNSVFAFLHGDDAAVVTRQIETICRQRAEENPKDFGDDRTLALFRLAVTR